MFGKKPTLEASNTIETLRPEPIEPEIVESDLSEPPAAIIAPDVPATSERLPDEPRQDPNRRVHVTVGTSVIRNPA